MKSAPAILIALCAAAAAQSRNPLTDAINARYQRIKLDLLDTAEVMPESDYGYKLTPAQRSFGQWIGHTATGNYSFCAGIKGEKPPDTQHLGHLTAKSELSKALRDSFAYCDEAFKGMTDQKALTEIAVGDRKVYPAQGMVNIVSSDNEHYGNMVGYLRIRGITPPSTSRAQKKK